MCGIVDFACFILRHNTHVSVHGLKNSFQLPFFPQLNRPNVRFSLGFTLDLIFYPFWQAITDNTNPPFEQTRFFLNKPGFRQDRNSKEALCVVMKQHFFLFSTLFSFFRWEFFLFPGFTLVFAIKHVKRRNQTITSMVQWHKACR